MRRILIFLFLVSSLSLTAQEIIKVGSYNVAESDARMRQVNKAQYRK